MSSTNQVIKTNVNTAEFVNHRSQEEKSSKIKVKSSLNGTSGVDSSGHRHRKQTDHKYRLTKFSDWSEQTSKAGKRYYYNCKTEVSQWEKPPEWVEYEKKQRHMLRHGHATSNDRTLANTSAQQLLDLPSTSSMTYDRHIQHQHSQSSKTVDHKSKAIQREGGSQLTCKNSIANRYDTERNLDVQEHVKLEPAWDQQSSASQHSSSSFHLDQKRKIMDGMTESRQLKLLKRENLDTELDDSNGESETYSDIFRDLSIQRMPHLVKTVAQRFNTDMSDAEVLLKRRFASALEAERDLDPRDVIQSVIGEIYSELETLIDVSDAPNNSSSNNNGNSTIESEIPPVNELSESHKLFCKDNNVTCAVRDWAASHFENQAYLLAGRSFQSSLKVAQVSADLKCARSLVRTAEIKSTLLEARISYLRNQYLQLETISKPVASTSIMSSL